MNGNDEYNIRYKDKINSIIKNDIVKGYYSYIVNFTSNSTAFQYITYVNKFIKIINKDIEEINFMDYLNYMASLENKSSSYKISVYSALKKFSEFLFVSKISKENYMLNIRRPKVVESQKTRDKRSKGFLNEEEIKEYLLQIKTGAGNDIARAKQYNWIERDLAIITIFLVTGMRCSALYRLDVNDIDFNKHIITTTEKGEKVIVYSIDEKTEQIIKDWIVKRKNILNDKEVEALFISNRKTRITNNAIANIISKYAEKIEGKHITPHKLRATFGIQIQNKYHDLYLTQRAMHHSNPKTTEIYIGRQEEDTDKITAAMSSLIF